MVMTIRELYSEIHGDYDKAISNLRKDELLKKYIKLFLSDGTFNMLETSLAEKDGKNAFLAAHTLKGLCLNFSFTTLCTSSSLLTENLRDGNIKPDSGELFEKVKSDYLLVTEKISNYFAQER